MVRQAGRVGFRRLGVAAVILAVAGAGELRAGESPGALARQILEATGIKGGLVVHLGCGDGKLTAALRASDSFLVHGLDTDPANVQKARAHIRSLGSYGKVSVGRWTGASLPYTDNLVNLVVSERLGEVPMAEVLRALAPNGVAYVRKGERWEKTVKPRPKEIDEWTHFLHDADGNAVAKDSVVGPPRHIQWVAAPKWARSHEHFGSVSVVVSSGGRLFYIVDEGPAASVTLPSKWSLVARDAFNGVLLWKRSIPAWEGQMRPFRSGPAELPRRLVAIRDRVYVTLGYRKPLTALDAATGRVVKTYAGTDGALEIVCRDGVLYVVAGTIDAKAAAAAAKRRGASPPPRNRRIIVLQADTGDLLWKKADADTAELMPLTLAAAGGRLFFQNTKELICLDATSGSERWRAARPISLKRPGWSTPTLVVCGDVVLSADRTAPAQAQGSAKMQWVVTMAGGGRPGEVVAFSATTGKELWRAKCSEGYNAPVDLFVVDGLLWTGKVIRARDPGFTEVRDVRTGEVRKRFAVDRDFLGVGMPHHRCHRNKATERYILASKAGIEFVDVQTGKVLLHNWVRGTCQHGIVPCNGLVYAPSHSCACFIKAKLGGFNALAPAREPKTAAAPPSASERLEQGPAYSEIGNRQSAIGNAHDWPTHRHDAARTGSTSSPVPAALKRLWQADLGGRLSSLVCAGGKLLVASIDTHTVHALDSDEGKPVWSYTAGGRVDSPPTVHSGLALFGSADGYVYCLRASDGKLAWRFRAAREDRRTVAYGQVESVWPVPGSVLVEDGVVSFVAGRSSFLDGGITLYRLDLATGKMLSETCVSDYDPKTGKQPPARGFEMEGAFPDVLSSDGASVYLRHIKFDRKGVRQRGTGLHLFSPTGFLDGSWWHRSYWIWGTSFNAGWGGWWRAGNQTPAGRLLVLDDSSVYGFGRSFYPAGNAGQWRTGEHYRLYATSKKIERVKPPAPKPAPKTAGKKKRRRKRPPARSQLVYRWAERVPLEVHAMVLAGQTLFVAGPLGDGRHSLDAFEGRKGVVLWAISAADGKKLAEAKLESPPVFDGMIAARRRLYISTRRGRVLCLGGE